jgi:hypothetical protein
MSHSTITTCDQCGRTCSGYIAVQGFEPRLAPINGYTPGVMYYSPLHPFADGEFCSIACMVARYVPAGNTKEATQ